MLTLIALGLILPQQTYEIARQVSPGAKQAYTIKTTIHAGLRIAYSGRMLETIDAVEPNGTYTVRVTTTAGELKVGDDTFTSEAAEPTLIKRSTSGAVLEIVGVTSDPDRYRLATLDAFYYPGKAVAVGDTWRREGPGNVRQAAPPYRADYTVEALETVGGVEALKIKAAVQEIRSEKAARAEGTYWISTKDGWIVKADLDWIGVPFWGSPNPVNVKLAIERIPIADGS